MLTLHIKNTFHNTSTTMRLDDDDKVPVRRWLDASCRLCGVASCCCSHIITDDENNLYEVETNWRYTHERTNVTCVMRNEER